jgi:hypothetical protein
LVNVPFVADDEPWRLQVMLAMIEGDRWFYRRDRRIWRERVEVGGNADAGVPVLTPVIQLLY